MSIHRNELEAIRESFKEELKKRDALLHESTLLREDIEKMKKERLSLLDEVEIVESGKDFHETNNFSLVEERDGLINKVTELEKEAETMFVKKENAKQECNEVTSTLSHLQESLHLLQTAHEAAQSSYEVTLNSLKNIEEQLLEKTENLRSLQSEEREYMRGIEQDIVRRKEELLQIQTLQSEQLLAFNREREQVGKIKELVFQYAEEMGISLPITQIYHGKN